MRKKMKKSSNNAWFFFYKNYNTNNLFIDMYPSTIQHLKSTWLASETPLNHHTHHNDMAVLLSNIQTKLWVNWSTDTTSIDYLLKSISSVSPWHKHQWSDIVDHPQFVPTGMIMEFAVATPPAWYLLCDWSNVSRSTYSGLFSVIGTTYGIGDGTSTFSLPDRRWRVSVGVDTSQVEFNTIGKTGWSKTHTLSLWEIPAHTHTYTSAQINTVSVGTDWPANYTLANTSSAQSTGSIGGGQEHNNLQPYTTAYFIIKT